MCLFSEEFSVTAYEQPFHMKKSLICMWMESHFYMKEWAPRLTLGTRLNVIRKWPITTRWLGHVIEWIRLVSLRLPCAGHHLVKGNLGRPKTTWRRTVIAELSEVKLTWDEAQHVAQNRAKWKEIVVALCPTGDEEEWRKMKSYYFGFRSR